MINFSDDVKRNKTGAAISHVAESEDFGTMLPSLRASLEGARGQLIGLEEAWTQKNERINYQLDNKTHDIPSDTPVYRPLDWHEPPEPVEPATTAEVRSPSYTTQPRPR